jgi:hypothetical protein
MACLGGCVGVLPPNAVKSRPSITGYITGFVVDSKGRPVAGAMVWGIFLQRWTIGYVPPGFEIVNCRTNTDANGRFSFNASEKLDKLYAETRDIKMNGQVDHMTQEGNIIRLYPFQIDRENVH